MTQKEESLEERLKDGKKGTEPTYFFRRDQINEDVYEYTESKDVHVKGDYTSGLIRAEKNNATFQGYTGEYFKDTNSGATLARLKRKAVEEAKKLCIELGHDGLYIDDKDIKMEFLGTTDEHEALVEEYGSPEVTYSLTAVVQFYRKKELQDKQAAILADIDKRLKELEEIKEGLMEEIKKMGLDQEKHAERIKKIQLKKPEPYKGK